MLRGVDLFRVFFLDWWCPSFFFGCGSFYVHSPDVCYSCDTSSQLAVANAQGCFLRIEHRKWIHSIHSIALHDIGDITHLEFDVSQSAWVMTYGPRCPQKSSPSNGSDGGGSILPSTIRHGLRWNADGRGHELAVNYNWGYMSVSKNSGTPKWMVYNEKPY